MYYLKCRHLVNRLPLNNATLKLHHHGVGRRLAHRQDEHCVCGTRGQGQQSVLVMRRLLGYLLRITASVQDNWLVCLSILRKISKICAIRCQILMLNHKMHQIRFSLGLRPDPAVGTYSAPPGPRTVLREPTSRGRERKGGRERGRRRKVKGRKGRGGEARNLVHPTILSWPLYALVPDCISFLQYHSVFSYMFTYTARTIIRDLFGKITPGGNGVYISWRLVQTTSHDNFTIFYCKGFDFTRCQVKAATLTVLRCHYNIIHS